MIKNVGQFLKEKDEEKKQFLKNLDINKATKIFENLITSKLLNKFICKPKDFPISIEKLLKYGKFTR